MNIALFHKSWTATNYRSIVDVKNLDICPIIATIDNFPQFRGYFNQFKSNYPGMVHNCPYKNLIVNNASLTNQPDGMQHATHETPNGLHKSDSRRIQAFLIFCKYFSISTVRLHFHDKIDGQIFDMTMLIETKKPGRTFEI